jgi:gliding motility-associated-like protein
MGFAQAFNFSCARDTTVFQCTPSCITLKTTIPDIRASTAGYTVNQVSIAGTCFSPYVAPENTTGTTVGLVVDDRYSGIINLPFNFPFYGASYNRIVASINGMLSFDVSKATALAHFGILFTSFLNGNSGTPQNLPNTRYDRAIIMGPYHDLIPTTLTSPGLKVQYQVVGTAPYRKWVLSYYKVPLFRNTCNLLIENSHQIVLHESTGIVEVFLFSKEICTAWNQGRAIVGMQDLTRTNGIMAPGRGATDPPWGSVNMNEVWRFVPSAGATLLKRVELYDLAGNLVSTGTTADLGNGKLEASFPNVCSNAGTTSFVVRPVYQKIDDAAAEVFGSDTIRINKIVTPVSATVMATPTLCGPASGSITATNPTGIAPFQYSIDGTTFQASNTFSGLPQGNYTIIVKDAIGCTGNVSANVDLQNNLTVKTISDTAVCPGAVFTAITTTNLVGGTTFNWMPATGLSSTGAQSPVITVGATSRYIVTATNGACVAKDTLDLTIGTVPTVQTIADTTVCPGTSFTAQTFSDGTSFAWSPATGLNNATARSPVITIGTVNRYIVTAFIGACSSSDTLNLTIAALPTVSAGPDQTIIEGDSVQLAATGSAGTYVWTPSIGLNASNILQPVAKPLQTTLYTVQVTSAQECKATDNVLVTMLPYCVKPMDAFTPNGDGRNDVWLLTNGACITSVSVSVYNRYGSLVYESKDYKNDWNGTFKGKALPDATYYFIATYRLMNGSSAFVKGNVTILR